MLYKTFPKLIVDCRIANIFVFLQLRLFVLARGWGGKSYFVRFVIANNMRCR